MSLKGIIIVLLILLLIDIYVFRGVVNVVGSEAKVRVIVSILYWFVFVFIGFLSIYIHFKSDLMNNDKVFYRHFYTMMGTIVLFYVPKLVFIVFVLIADILNISNTLLQKTELITEPYFSQNRRALLLKGGLVISSIPLLSIIHGIGRGRFKFKVSRLNINSAKIPESFNGFKVLQISDWHIGSFLNHPEKIKEIVKLVNKQNADIILFTGDMVNNKASEMRRFIEPLSKLKARYGKYAVLGNHDYGDYINWENSVDKKRNRDNLEKQYASIDFILLNNDNHILKKNNESISLIGVENWGVPPFPQRGNLKLALQGVSSESFKILMSHDPSHWDAEVIGKTNIDLTLPGHTHGMQFGIKIKGFKWSPVKWKYPRWSGLYEEGSQMLYVNVGVGHLAFPGRVGILPEVTEFILKKV